MAPSKKAEQPKNYYLIGLPNKHIGRTPPTLRKFLQNCLLYHEQRETESDSIAKAIENAMTVWQNMGIALKRVTHCKRELKRAYKQNRNNYELSTTRK